MAPVKLLAVAIFLCIFTISRAFPTNESVIEKEMDSLVNLTKAQTKMYVYARYWYEQPGINISYPKEIECASYTAKFFKNDGKLFLTIDNVEFNCNLPKLVGLLWKCEKLSQNNGNKKISHDVQVWIGILGGIRIRYPREKYSDTIGVHNQELWEFWYYNSNPHPKKQVARSIDC